MVDRSRSRKDRQNSYIESDPDSMMQSDISNSKVIKKPRKKSNNNGRK